ncbi:MAG: hypothetical protein LN561_05620 [Rickettsia endosymbiont of Labidopullus appendiculatus]|nr:hypothetical protein [Rickettsia endosymbiont of Labidopullus appendiculatus]
MAKSQASFEPLKITPTQAKIKDALENLASRYDQTLTNFDNIIENWKGDSSRRSDPEYIRAAKGAFKAIEKGTEYEYVEVHGHGTHLIHRSDPYEMLHITFCGRQGKQFTKIIDIYCVNNSLLKDTLTTFVIELNNILQPFVSDLHSTRNACKVSHTEKGLDIEFSSAWMANNMKKYYATKAGENDQLKVLFGKQFDPIELQENHIVVRHSTGLGDVGVFKGGNYNATRGKQPAEVAISFHNEQERDAFLHLFDGSYEIVRTYDNLKAVYFCDNDSQTTLPYDDHHKIIDFIGSTEVCDWN